MIRSWLIVSIGALSLGTAACGGYDEKNAAYDANDTAYDDAGNAAYGAQNEAYDSSEGNAAYAPPDSNHSANNVVDQNPPPGVTTNGY